MSKPTEVVPVRICFEDGAYWWIMTVTTDQESIVSLIVKKYGDGHMHAAGFRMEDPPV